MTSCGCFEAISAILPMCNGIMTVDRDYGGMTPSGMKFTTLAGSVGGGAVTFSTVSFFAARKRAAVFPRERLQVGNLVFFERRLAHEELRERA